MSPERSRLSRRKRLLFAAAIVLLPLFALELFFRLTGMFAPDEPFTTIRDDHGVELVQYNWNPVKPRFMPDKAPDSLRVMVFGESTALGFPYQPRSSFGEMLRVMLEQSLPGLQVEVINLGRVGMNSAEVVDLMPRALRYNPDLVIVYSGHNEFVSLRNPASVGVRLGRKLGRVRVARAAGGLVQIGFGGVMLAVQKKMEEQVLAPPRPDRVSARDFDRVLARYRQNLTALAGMCRCRKIPLVLNTLTSNLVGWPPEDRVFPRGVSDQAQRHARDTVARARQWTEERREGRADPDQDGGITEAVVHAMAEAPGYAPLTYWLALSDRHDPAKKLDADSADLRARFLKALSEEAHTVTVHRAPPELNAAVRQVAKEGGAWLAENEPLSFHPELFDDHCHPTLAGQREIAATIYSLLRDNGYPRPAVEWAQPPVAFDLPAYEHSHRLDAAFLHEIRVRLAVFLGIERDLPFNSELTRRQLNAAIATDRHDPLPALLLAAVCLHYDDNDGAAAALKPWANRQDRLRLAIDRYFTRAVDLRDGAVLFRIEGEPGLPPLRGLLTSGIVEKGKPRGRAGEPRLRSYYNVEVKL